jgi:hypothetical protein
MRHSLLMLIVCVFTATALPLNAAEPADAGYEIHEWGVFPIARNDKWAMSDLRAEWATFPDFFCRVWPEEKLPWRGGADKPVVFFHGTPRLRINLTVKFSEGRPLVWWPNAESPAAGVSEYPKDRLVFRITLLGKAERNMHDVPKGHWMEALRAVKCSQIITPGSHDKGDFEETEQFLYYDGIMKAPAAPTVSRGQNGGLVVATENDFDLLDVLVIDQSFDGKKLSIGRSMIDKIPSGKQSTAIEMVEVPEGAARAARQNEVLAEVQKRITVAGLNADEAASLINVWREGFLANRGLWVLYRVPQATYDKWLPLTAQPAPKKTVRVGLVLHSHLEPELDAHLEGLIKQLGAEDFAARTAAIESLLKIGGAAFPMLEKNANHADPEIARHCQDILKSLDTRPALTAPAKGR